MIHFRTNFKDDAEIEAFRIDLCDAVAMESVQGEYPAFGRVMRRMGKSRMYKGAGWWSEMWTGANQADFEEWVNAETDFEVFAEGSTHRFRRKAEDKCQSCGAKEVCMEDGQCSDVVEQH